MDMEKTLDRSGQFGTIATVVVLIYGMISRNQSVFFIGLFVLMVFPLGTGIIEWYFRILKRNSILFVLYLTEGVNKFEKLKINILNATSINMLDTQLNTYIQKNVGIYLEDLEEDDTMKVLKEEIEKDRKLIRQLSNKDKNQIQLPDKSGDKKDDN